MTRKEAIEQITLEKEYIEPIPGSDKTVKALDMAIEALKQIEAIEGIIDVSNLTLQEDVLKYKIIVDVVKGEDDEQWQKKM